MFVLFNLFLCTISLLTLVNSLWSTGVMKEFVYKTQKVAAFPSIFMTLCCFTYSVSALPSAYIFIYIIIVELLNLLQFLLSSWRDRSWKIHFYKSVRVFALINKRYIKLPLPKAGCSFYLMIWLFFSGSNWHHPREMCSTESRPTTPLQHFKSRKSVLNRQILFFPPLRSWVIKEWVPGFTAIFPVFRISWGHPVQDGKRRGRDACVRNKATGIF